MKTYKVVVKCTNALKDTFAVKAQDSKEILYPKSDYFNCINGVIYVITDSPAKIYEKFKDAVISIEDIGFGYILNG